MKNQYSHSFKNVQFWTTNIIEKNIMKDELQYNHTNFKKHQDPRSVETKKQDNEQQKNRKNPL